MTDDRERLEKAKELQTAQASQASKETRLAEIQKKINDLMAERERILKEEA